MVVFCAGIPIVLHVCLPQVPDAVPAAAGRQVRGLHQGCRAAADESVHGRSKTTINSSDNPEVRTSFGSPSNIHFLNLLMLEIF